jgi:hypothetical protein
VWEKQDTAYTGIWLRLEEVVAYCGTLNRDFYVPGININEVMNGMIPMSRLYKLLKLSFHPVMLPENMGYKSIISTAQLYERA